MTTPIVPIYPEAGSALPVHSVSGPCIGGPAIPVYVVNDGRPTLGQPARRVKIITDADLTINGGNYWLEGRPFALPVVSVTSGKDEGNVAIPVYPVNAWPDSTPVTPIYDRIMAMRPSDLIAYYPLDDTSGAAAREVVNGAMNILTNPGLETVTGNVNTVFLGWSASRSAGGGDVLDETSVVHAGGHACKLITGTNSWQTYLYRNVTVVAGVAYQLKFWSRGDGTHPPTYNVYDVDHSGSITSGNGTAGAVYAESTVNFTAPAGCTTITLYFNAPDGDPAYYAYFDDIRVIAPAGSHPSYAAIVGSGTTLGETGIGDGSTAFRFDKNGALSLPVGILIALTEADGSRFIDKGTILCWCAFSDNDTFSQPDQDANYYTFWSILNDASTLEFYAQKDGGENFLNVPIANCGTGAGQLHTQTMTEPGTAFFCVAITWDFTVPTMKAYINGVQDDAGISNTSGDGVIPWTAPPLQAYIAALYDLRRHEGKLAHWAVWGDVLTQPQIASLSVV